MTRTPETMPVGMVVIFGAALLMMSIMAIDTLARGLGAGMFEPKYPETARDEIYQEQKVFRPPPVPPRPKLRQKSASDALFDPRFKPYDYDDPVKWRTRERDHEQGGANPGSVDPVPLFRF